MTRGASTVTTELHCDFLAVIRLSGKVSGVIRNRPTVLTCNTDGGHFDIIVSVK